MIPESWCRVEIGQVAEIVTGSTPPTAVEENYGGPFLFVSPADLGNDKYVRTTGKTLSRQGFSISRPVRAGSVLFTCIGSSIGKIGMAAQELATNQQINAVVCDPKTASDEYIYYTLDYLSSRLRLLAGEQAIPIINKSTFAAFEVPLPPLREQLRIAEILSTWDEALALLDRRIELAAQRKQGLMQRLLTGRVRFAEFEGEPWRETELGEFFKEFSRRNKGGNDLTVLSCSTIHGIVPQEQIFSRRIASKNTERYKIVERGDLVYDPMLLWDGSIGFVDSVDRGIVSPAYSTFRFRRNRGDLTYFRYLIKTHYLLEHYKYISQGTNVRRRKAPVEAFLKLQVRVPSRFEQRRIAEVLDTCDREIELLQRKRELLRQQKKGLMQRLLTGRVRVRV